MSKEEFYNLNPDDVLHALEKVGYQPTGEFIQLNSYENRVFDVKLENSGSIITKFYRPGRWSRETIQDEHDFLDDLYSRELPVITAVPLPDKQTIGLSNGMFFSVFPKARGRMVEEFTPDQMQRMGRTIARMHNVGAQKKAKNRLTMNVESYGIPSLKVVEDWIFPDLLSAYKKSAEHIFADLEKRLKNVPYLRIHGDCHRGNILKTDPKDGVSEYFFIDFDDFCNGPAVQDLWMLLSAPDDTDEALDELEPLFHGYNEIRKMTEDELDLIPHLRALRIVHYSAWIARRWEDPTFPKLFPQFQEYNYWAEELEALNSLAARI